MSTTETGTSIDEAEAEPSTPARSDGTSVLGVSSRRTPVVYQPMPETEFEAWA